MPQFRWIVLENPLLIHLAKADTGPSYTVPLEQAYAGGEGEWEFDPDLDVGCYFDKATVRGTRSF